MQLCSIVFYEAIENDLIEYGFDCAFSSTVYVNEANRITHSAGNPYKLGTRLELLSASKLV